MNRPKTIAVIVAATLVITWLSLGIIRFALNDTKATHYHANFAVFVNGERLPFDNPLYYEEVGSGCSLTDESPPQERVHLHDNEPSVIHVHDRNVTWGHFFNNIDYSIGEFHVETWESLFDANDPQRVRYILNGRPVTDVKNEVIGNEDRLLIDVSDDIQSALEERYDSIDTSASEFNTQPDPAACKGSEPSLRDRVQKAFLSL